MYNEAVRIYYKNFLRQSMWQEQKDNEIKERKLLKGQDKLDRFSGLYN